MKRFPSIKKNSDFRRIYKGAKSYANRLLVMYVAGTDRDDIRVGISCSKKIGNSVVRHRITRKLREIFRLNIEGLEKGLDIVIVVRKGAENAAYQEIESAYLELCSRHHIIKEDSK